MKKILSVMLSVVLIITLIPLHVLGANDVTAWDGSIEAPTKLVNIDGVYYYEISTAKELAYIAQTGGEWLGYNYVLANDIVLNDVELTYDAEGNLTVDESALNQWTPIHGFNGVFNGNNFSISGVYVNSDESVGFFSATIAYGSCSSATIMNLHIKNAYIKGKEFVGGIVNGSEGSISNCSYNGAIIGSGERTSDEAGFAGIAGMSTGSLNITNCINYGDIFGEDYVGGVVGLAYECEVTNCKNYGSIISTGNCVGGILALFERGKLSNCTNYGEVSGTSGVGGIVGSQYHDSISNCTNYGEVSGTSDVGGIIGYQYGSIMNCTNYGIVKGKKNGGGIIGRCSSYYSPSRNLYNTGTVIGETFVGGVLGYGYGDSDDYITVSKAYNTGDVSGNDYVGGLIGKTTYTNVSDSYSAGNVTGASNTGAVIGYSDSLWGKGSVSNCYYLKTETVNSQFSGFGNGQDVEGIITAKDVSFFCFNADKTLNGGHSYDGSCDDTCNICSLKRPVNSHIPSDWKIDVAATCTENGSKHKECIECGVTIETEIISAKGHTASSWKTDTKATVYKAGKKHKECTECGEVLETAEIPQFKCTKPKLKEISNTEYGVKITWGKVSGADSYAVYRKTSGGSYKKIGTTSKTYYTDKKATSGKKYYYIVKAVNEAGNSDSSSSLSKYYLADPTLKTPSSSKTGVKLTWSKVSGADGYMVYRKTSSGSYSRIATVKGSTKVTYTDKSAKKGKKYTYKVKAYKSKTYSAYSNTKTITDKY